MSIAERVPVSYERVNTFVETVREIYHHINRKAFELYEERGGVDGFDLEDWHRAESALIRKPSVTMRRFNEDVAIEIAMPKVDPDAVTLQVASLEMLVATVPDEEGRQVFRMIHFPEAIDVESVDAEFVGTDLRITATIVDAGR